MTWTTFFYRRWMRIAPAYFTTLMIYLANKALRKPCVEWWWTHILFINNVVGPGINVGSCMTHTWSIAVEMQFYLLSPLVAWGMLKLYASRGHFAALCLPAVLALASVAARAVVVVYNAQRVKDEGYTEHVYEWSLTCLYTKTYMRASPYFLGMMVAWIFVKGKIEVMLDKLGRIMEIFIDICAVALWCIVAYLGPGGSTDLSLEGIKKRVMSTVGTDCFCLLLEELPFCRMRVVYFEGPRNVASRPYRDSLRGFCRTGFGSFRKVVTCILGAVYCHYYILVLGESFFTLERDGTSQVVHLGNIVCFAVRL